MINVFVDTAVLGCPVAGSPSGCFIAYADRLTRLYETSCHRYVRLLIPARTLDVLAEAERLPPWDNAITFLQPRDVSRLFYGMLSRLGILEDLVGVADILVGGADVIPSPLESEQCVLLAEDHSRTLGLVCLASCAFPAGPEGVLFSDRYVGPSELRVSATIIDIDVTTFRGSISLPCDLAVVVSGISDIGQLYAVLHPEHLVPAGFVRDAIDLAVAARLLNEGGEPKERWPWGSHNYRLHPKFEVSLRDLDLASGDTRTRSVLRACVETVLGLQLRDTHDLRTDASGGAPQRVRTRDGATAWRRDIDHHHHLHYWRDGSEIELALVVPHNSYEIPE